MLGAVLLAELVVRHAGIDLDQILRVRIPNSQSFPAFAAFDQTGKQADLIVHFMHPLPELVRRDVVAVRVCIYTVIDRDIADTVFRKKTCPSAGLSPDNSCRGGRDLLSGPC